MKRNKINTVNRTLALAALVALIATPVLRADDNQSSDNSKSSENSSQSSENNKSSDNNSSDNSKSSDNNGGDNNNSDNSSKGTEVSVQSKAAPYGLNKAGSVMQGGSDTASKTFASTVLPSLTKFVASALPESVNNTKSKAFEIDPNKIVLANNTAVRAYFVSEGALYHNSIGVDAVAAGKKDPQSALAEASAETSQLIFPDASSSEGGFAASAYGTRTAAEPVLPGDFVNVGTFNKGTKLDFFLIANGANGGKDVFSTDEALNQDGFKQHVAGFTTHIFAVPQLNSPYIFLSFEDMWSGGDKDINDTIIALDVGAATVNSLLATPEPAMPLTFAACLGLALVAVRKNKQATAAV